MIAISPLSDMTATWYRVGNFFKKHWQEPLLGEAVRSYFHSVKFCCCTADNTKDGVIKSRDIIPIKSIEVYSYVNDVVRIQVYFSLFYKTDFSQDFMHLFGTKPSKFAKNQIYIQFNTKEEIIKGASRFVSWLKYRRKICGNQNEIFSEDLIKDLEQVFRFIILKHSDFSKQHCLPEYLDIHAYSKQHFQEKSVLGVVAHINPELINVKTAVDLFHQPDHITRKINSDRFRMIFREGENPNTSNARGETALHNAIIFSQPHCLNPDEGRNIVRTLLSAGACLLKTSLNNGDPFFLNCPLELVYEMQLHETDEYRRDLPLFSILIKQIEKSQTLDPLIRPEKSLQAKLKVQKVECYQSSVQEDITIRTAISLNKGMFIRSHLMTTRYFLKTFKRQISEVVALSMSVLPDPEDPQNINGKYYENFVKELYPLQSIKGDSPWIELITVDDNPEVIGFHVYRTLFIRTDCKQKVVVLIHELGGISEKSPTRNIGITPFFLERMGYMLKQIFPNIPIIVHGHVLDYEMYRLWQRDLSTARYNSPFLDTISKKILELEFPRDKDKIKDLHFIPKEVRIPFASKNSLEPKEPKLEKESDMSLSESIKKLDKKEFEDMRKENRAVVINRIIGKNTFNNTTEMLELRVGITSRMFINNVREMANLICSKQKVYLPTFKSLKPSNRPIEMILSDESQLHWFGRDKPLNQSKL